MFELTPLERFMAWGAAITLLLAVIFCCLHNFESEVMSLGQCCASVVYLTISLSDRGRLP